MDNREEEYSASNRDMLTEKEIQELIDEQTKKLLEESETKTRQIVEEEAKKITNDLELDSKKLVSETQDSAEELIEGSIEEVEEETRKAIEESERLNDEKIRQTQEETDQKIEAALSEPQHSVIPQIVGVNNDIPIIRDINNTGVIPAIITNDIMEDINNKKYVEAVKEFYSQQDLDSPDKIISMFSFSQENPSICNHRLILNKDGENTILMQKDFNYGPKVLEQVLTPLAEAYASNSPVLGNEISNMIDPSRVNLTSLSEIGNTFGIKNIDTFSASHVSTTINKTPAVSFQNRQETKTQQVQQQKIENPQKVLVKTNNQTAAFTSFTLLLSVGCFVLGALTWLIYMLIN